MSSADQVTHIMAILAIACEDLVPISQAVGCGGCELILCLFSHENPVSAERLSSDPRILGRERSNEAPQTSRLPSYRDADHSKH